MKLNGYYIDHVEKWLKNVKGNVKLNEIGNYIEPKEQKIKDIEHKIRCSFKSKRTADELHELCSNPAFDIVTISDFYIDEYNGIYQLVKGNVDIDAGNDQYILDLWLENKSEWVKQSVLSEPLDLEYEYLIENTSTISDLNGTTEGSSTWGVVDDGFGISSGSEDIFIFGDYHWNSIIVTSDIVFSNTSGSLGFVFRYVNSSNYYKVILDDDTIILSRVYDSDEVVLSKYEIPSDDLITGFQAGTTYNLKLIYTSNQMSVHFENKHVITVFDDVILNGKVGLYSSGVYGFFKNFNVKIYIPQVSVIPTGNNYDNYPSLNTFMKTSTGFMQHFSNIDENIINKQYTSNVHTGEVRVWDTMENDFSQSYETVRPKPLLWKRVYNINHKFVGNVFIENGLFGILYSSEGVYHYVYDRGHRNGDLINLDFQQTPNKIIHNDSLTNTNFTSYNQSSEDWSEDGLHFDTSDGSNGVTDDVEIKNVNGIPELTSKLPTYGSKIDVELSLNNDDGNIFSIYKNQSEAGLRLFFDDYKLKFGVNNDMEEFDYTFSNGNHNISVIHGIDLYGQLLYKDGLLEEILTDQTYEYQTYETDPVEIGNLSDDENSGFDGYLKTLRYKLKNKGITVPKSKYKPYLWYSFDKFFWNPVNNVLYNRGTLTTSTSLVATPRFIKNGFYNESMYFEVGKYIQDTTVSFGTLSEFTIEFRYKLHNYVLHSADTYSNLITIIDSITKCEIDVRTHEYYDSSTGESIFSWDCKVVDDNGTSTFIYTNDTIGNLDDKWHHFALTYSGSSVKFYHDGELLNTSTVATSTVSLNSDTTFKLGVITSGSSVTMEYDEFLFYNYELEPEVFGVMVVEDYLEYQAYPKSMVEWDGSKYVLKDEPIYPTIDMENTFYYIDFNYLYTYNMSAVTYRSNLTKNGYITPGKWGIGIGMESDSSTSTIYIESYDTKSINFNEPFTLQFYFSSTSISDYQYLLYLYDPGYTRVYVYLTGSKLTIATASTTVDNSYTLSSDTIYQITILVNQTSMNYIEFTIYVDGEHYKTMVLKKAVGNYPGIYTFYTSKINKFWLSNVQVFQDTLVSSEFGIICDTEREVPRRYGSYGIYTRIPSTSESAIDGSNIKITKITPELVEIELVDPIQNVVLPTWIESGSYFYKIDRKNMSYISTGYEAIIMYFDAKVCPRFNLTIGHDGSYTLYDSHIKQTSFATTTNPYISILFDYISSNMMYVQVSSTNSPYLGDLNRISSSQYYRINNVFNDCYDGVSLTGFIPNKHVNQMFFDASELEGNGTPIYTNVSDDWFISVKETVTATHVLETNYLLNYKKFKKGSYLIVTRGKGSASWQTRLYNDTDGVIIGDPENTSASSSYSYNYYVATITNEDAEYNLQIGYCSSGEVYIDYVVIIPLTNGIDMPVDLITQGLQKTTKRKILY